MSVREPLVWNMEYGTNASDAINELIINRSWTINGHNTPGGEYYLLESIRSLMSISMKTLSKIDQNLHFQEIHRWMSAGVIL